MSHADQFREGIVRVAALLDAWPHGAAMIGGVAVTLRVRPRFTDDLDLVITVPEGSLDDLIAVASTMGFFAEQGELARELAEAGLLRLWSSADDDRVGVDLIFVDSEQLAETVRRATPVDLGTCRLNVASVEDILILKLEANRPQDIDDIIAIKDAHGESLDMAYVLDRCERLDLLDVLGSYFRSEAEEQQKE